MVILKLKSLISQNVYIVNISYKDLETTNYPQEYLDHKIIPVDPLQSIDQEGGGRLVKMGVKKGRAMNSKLKIGICGEHGGDPCSVHFFHKTGLDYVSCSPFRVPIAYLSVAQNNC